MKILITGADGQLGRCLQDKLQETDYEVVALNRKSMDITDSTAVKDVFEQHKPDVVINAAAYTAVDKAESEPELAFAVNETGPKNLATECNKHHIPIIHISTDYVFDGTKPTPYVETDKTNPQTVYGKSKLAGESAVKANTDRYFIIRTSWVFSEYGNNFVKTMLRIADNKTLSIVNDQFGGPTCAGDLAKAIIKIVESIRSEKMINWGIYHLSGFPYTNWYEFACVIFYKAKLQKIFDKVFHLKPITTNTAPGTTKRPLNSRLNLNKIQQEFDIKPSDWAGALENLNKYQ